MNLLKGNINFTNELLDACKSREDLKDNDILIELMRALKQMEPKLLKLIEEAGDGLNEDVFSILFMVKDDMDLTFDRFKAIKEGRHPSAFVPGEHRVLCHYLEPTHHYQFGLDTLEKKD